MKYFGLIIAWTMLAAGLTACTEESYPGLASDKLPLEIASGEGSWPMGQKIPVEVGVNTSLFTFDAVTRGTGPFVDPAEETRDKQRYSKIVWRIFAFRDTRDQQGPLDYDPDYTARSGAPNGKADCLVDGTDAAYFLGLPATLAADHSGALQMKQDDLMRDTLMYYDGDTYRDVGYNFYVSCLDDMEATEANAHRDANGVYYDLEMDGTRDYMAGSAPRLTPYVLDNNYSNVRLSNEQRNRILNIGNYSAYSAKMGIHPIADVQHLLACLRFFAYPADNSVVDIGVESIEIECHNKGQLYVVALNPDDVGLRLTEERNYISLMDRNPDGGDMSPFVTLSPDRNQINWIAGMDANIWQNNTPTHVGGDMMVPQDSAYRMRVTFVQTLKHINEKTGEYDKARVTATYRLTAPHIEACIDPQTGRYRFRAGQAYNVNIGVYGMRRIEVNVTLGGWKNGGEISNDDWW